MLPLVPLAVTASVPDVVIGLPPTEKIPGIVSATDVTVPLPPPAPQSLPVPERTPDVLTCRHCVEPVMPENVVPPSVTPPLKMFVPVKVLLLPCSRFAMACVVVFTAGLAV